MNKLVPNLRFPQFAKESEWEEKKLGEVSDKIGDGLHGTPVYSEDTDIYFINGNNLVDGKIFISKNTKKVDFNTFKKNDKHLNKNTLLISINGTIGNVAKYNGEKVMLGKSVCYINFTNQSDYFYHVLNTQTIQDYFYLELTGSTIKNLSLKTIRETKVAIPSLAEQTQIGNFLTAVDTRILLLKQKLELLKSYKKGIMAQIFSQELRFKDGNGQKFPEWEEKTLGEVCQITTGKLNANAMVENGEYRFYTCAKDFYFIDKYAFDTEALLVSGNGANVGYVHYYKGKFNAYQRTYVLDNFTQNILYIKCFLNNFLHKRIAEEKNDGNTPYIVLDTLAGMLISLPSLAEQTKIAEFLTAIDQKINLTEQQIAQSEEWKRGLLQAMLV